MPRVIAAVFCLVLFPGLGARIAAQGTPIGFAETWALATDRGKVLEQLIPGTQEYYYYSCRHRQDTGAFAEVEPLLRAWIQRHGRSPRVEEIENRQALLTFDTDPAATLALLQRRLGLRFDHQRQLNASKQDLPATLDPELVSAAAFARRALQRHPRSVQGFRPSAYEGLLAGQLDDELLRSLLGLLQRPDVANLPALVVRDLGNSRSRGFGSLKIHRLLLQDQLDECVRLRPDLLNEQAFVESYLLRLAPGADVDWHRDAKAREAYLDRLHAFAQRLSSAHNSLKAHVLHHRLRHDLAAGAPDADRLMAYLRLPRPTVYVRREWLQGRGRAGEVVDANRTFPTGMERIGNDEPLVRIYLMHFFKDADSYQAYAEVMRDDYLKRVFAESKILAGVGDMERWYSMLDNPAYYEALKERVEIEFAPTQRKYYGKDEPVTIDVDVKNVEKLLVKVFEVNTFNYYRQLDREVDASITLDGLVANEEFTREYSDSPLRRVRRRFELASLRGPGVYIVELIGNGMSSRAVVHKGRLQYTQRLGAAGQVFRVRDEAGRPLDGASIHFGGKSYAAEDDGEIVIPYSTQPGRRSLILQHAGLSTLAQFEHAAESYALSAGIHLDRESLLTRRKARVLVRPSLQLNGRPVSLEVLEAPVLTIRARDAQGVESALDVRDFKLFADRESVHEIQVPDGLASLSITLHGKVQNLSRGQKVDVAATTRTFAVNQIDATDQTACPLLGRTPAGYVLDVLGKNGEPKAGRPVRLTLRHRDYTDPFDVTLKTDEQGRIRLGPLPGLESVEASGLPRSAGVWQLREATRTYPAVLHGIAGATLRVPYVGAAQAATRAAVSLIELRGSTYTRDAYQHVAIDGGFVELRGLPAGDYSLWLKEAQRRITVRVTDGEDKRGWAVGTDRMLQVGDRAPLHVTGVTTQGGELVVQLANARADARVHVVATRYLAAFDPFQGLRVPRGPSPEFAGVEHAVASYHSGREIGDEYRYILDRRFAKKYPGNMLARPGLILNPWALDEDARTAVGAEGGAGGKWGGRRGGSRQSRGGGGPGQGGGVTGAPGTFANLEFLPEPAVVLVNRRPDANGVVRVKLAALGAGQLVHVLAVDAEDTVYSVAVRPEQPLAPRSRQLAEALDAERHFAEQRRIEFVDAGGRAVLADATKAKAETYDSLASVHGLFVSLSGNQDLQKFAFVLRWPEMTPEEKRAAYEQHACHELHFFLHQKDRAFFDAVVRPYLANKADKTFLDHWLLGADLSRYVEPWAFGRLNVVERILLARRLTGQEASIRRHVQEGYELRPHDPAQLARLFDSALQGQALEGNNGLRDKLSALQEELKKGESKRRRGVVPPSKAPATPGATKPQAPGAARALGRAGEKQDAREPAEAEEVEEDAQPARDQERYADDAKDKAADVARRKNSKELYRAPDPTRPLVEHNYWHRRIQEQVADLIEVDGFWRDYAVAPAGRPFVSSNVAEAAGSFAEMMLALAVLDLPFRGGVHKTEVDGERLTMQAASPLLLVRKELVKAEIAPPDRTPPILVSQNYYRLDEPYRFVGNQRFDAYVTGEFLVDVAYGCRVVVTNPTSSPRKLDLLLQIPQGAIPIKGGFYTKGVPLELGPYATSSVEYAFYFPATGDMPHYPVHISRDGELVAHAEPRSLKVVPELSEVDTTSWQWISQNGTEQQVLDYIDGANLQRTALDKIAWRMQDKGFFGDVVGRLRKRHVYSEVLWSYGVRHADAAAVREYLRHQDGFLAQCGAALVSPLLTIDPVERHTWQQIEYEPLFNARAHRFGKRRTILNQHLAGQYMGFLRVLGDRSKLDDSDWMGVTYYLLLQDRVEAAMQAFARVDSEQLASRVQYDYMRAYMDFFTDGTSVAREIATRYRDYPVLRWQKMFRDVLNQLDEVSGKAVAQGDPDNRTQRQTALAAAEPALELEVEARRVQLRYKNVKSCEVSYYEMDVEFLFSTHPFVQQGSGSFAFIKPNKTETRDLPADKSELAFELPAEFRNSNVLIEVRAGGVVRREAYYANSLAVQWVERYGQLKVADSKTGRPLRTVYVKVFARHGDGRVRFYKDGYTDLRGRFDYASLSAQNPGQVERFSVLVLSEENGAVIREVAPPAQ